MELICITLLFVQGKLQRQCFLCIAIFVAKHSAIWWFIIFETHPTPDFSVSSDFGLR